MRRRLVIDQMKDDAETHRVECTRQPISTIQYCLDILYGKVRHEPDFGLQYIDGLRQIQKDVDHIVDIAAGNPPSSTKKSSMLRQMASDPAFAASAKQLIEKAEKLERQAEGLRYKFSKDRKEKQESV